MSSLSILYTLKYMRWSISYSYAVPQYPVHTAVHALVYTLPLCRSSVSYTRCRTCAGLYPAAMPSLSILYTLQYMRCLFITVGWGRIKAGAKCCASPPSSDNGDRDRCVFHALFFATSCIILPFSFNNNNTNNNDNNNNKNNNNQRLFRSLRSGRHALDILTIFTELTIEMMNSVGLVMAS